MVAQNMATAPMKFFLPHAASDEMAEEGFNGIRDWVAEQVGPTTTDRYLSIRYTRESAQVDACVGEKHSEIGEYVFAILRADATDGPFYICTPNHGVWRGVPIAIASSAVVLIEAFE
jgi:hypothetical protein